MSELSRFVYTKSHVILHVKADAQKVNLIGFASVYPLDSDFLIYAWHGAMNTAVKRLRMPKWIIFCQPRANFPRKILKENIGNNRCNAKFAKQN